MEKTIPKDGLLDTGGEQSNDKTPSRNSLADWKIDWLYWITKEESFAGADGDENCSRNIKVTYFFNVENTNPF